MRKLVLSSLVALTVLLPGCQQPDPNAFETYIAQMKDDAARPQAIATLEGLVKTVSTIQDPEAKKARVQEFVDKVIPELEAVWDNVMPQERTQILEMLRLIARPEGANLWSKALVLDGSEESRKQCLSALQGIKAANATGTVDALIAEFGKLIENPGKDKGKREGELRLEMATALGELKDPKAVDILIKALEQPEENQPVAIHRAAASALGQIGDPKATDALIVAPFRVKDAASTTDIANRCKLALSAIGEPAVPRVVDMLKGKHEAVNKEAASHDVDLLIVQQTAAGILGDMRAKKGVDELLAFMPLDGCAVPGEEPAKKKKKKKKKKADDEPEIDPAKASLRAFVARSLGFIGDEKPVEPLCSCINSTRNPGDMDETVDALGRIGGEKALGCLLETVKTGEYDPDAVASSDFVYQIRGIAARWSVLVAPPDKLEGVKAAFAANDSNEKAKKEITPYESGIKLAETCKADKDCYLKTLSDQTAESFAREKAAYELARLAKGDQAVGLEIAKAFKVRDPDARVTMALMADRVLEGKKCNECADAFQAVLDGEKGTMPPTMQLAVLTVRHTMAHLRE